MKHRLIIDFNDEQGMRDFVDGIQRDFDLHGPLSNSSEMIEKLVAGASNLPTHRQIHAYPADALDFAGQRVPGVRDVQWYILRAKGDRPNLSDDGGQTAEGA